MKAHWILAAVLVASPFLYLGSVLALEFCLALAGKRDLDGDAGEVALVFYSPLLELRSEAFGTAVEHVERGGWELRCRARSARWERRSGRVKLSSTGPELTGGCRAEWYCPGSP